MFKELLEKDLKRATHELGLPAGRQGFPSGDIVLTIPENSKFGDYSSNIALQLAKLNLKKDYHNPQEIANAILEKLGHPHYLESAEVAGAGFLNFFIKDERLIRVLESEETKEPEETKGAKKILVEFSHLNTHKACHIGHLRNITTGESISRLLEYQGNTVFRVTYGGDIGPHVAKALWGILHLNKEYSGVKLKSSREKAEFLGRAYALGSNKYEEDPKTKKEIDEMNKNLYAQDPKLKELWQETKSWSIGYFLSIYSRVGTLFDAEIWESDIQELGTLLVKESLGTVFIEDEGAIIFPGEKHGLHNRVFITRAGYPTYEGKELGLTRKEQEMFPYDFSLHVVANEQESFFEVTTRAIEIIDPHLKGKKKHLSYGMVNLSSGKMSSRKGEVITAESLIEDVKKAIQGSFGGTKNLSDLELDKIAIGSIKFFFLKYSIHSNIAFDIEKSVSLQGDSGPYLLYTHARINSLVNRGTSNVPVASDATQPENHANRIDPKKQNVQAQKAKIAQPFDYAQGKNFEAEEREILRQLEYFELTAEKAAKEFKPNEIGLYLLNLAKTFNFFYEKYPVIGSEKAELRLQIAKKVGETLKLGLYLLGIETVERM